MQVTVTGKHLGITTPIREYAQQKADKLPRYYDRITAIQVLASRLEHGHHEVEVIVHVEHADPVIAHASDHDLYASIDQTMDKLERQLTDLKERTRNHKYRVQNEKAG
jgi:putative sigma-54 modulation protein